MINQQLLIILLALRKTSLASKKPCLRPQVSMAMCSTEITGLSFSDIDCRNCPLSTRLHFMPPNGDQYHYMDITAELLRSFIDE